MSQELKEVYKHYKGGLYSKIGHSIHTETNEKLVVYKDMDGRIFCRPYEMFYGKVEVDGEEVRRFDFLGRI